LRIIRTSDIVGTVRDVACPRGGFNSLRLLTKKDGAGFGLHVTTVPAGRPQRWQYKNHIEACYCVSGQGQVLDENTGVSHTVEPGTCYFLDNHDPHVFTAFSTCVLVCVFSPPVVGAEVHDADGSYPEEKDYE